MDIFLLEHKTTSSENKRWIDFLCYTGTHIHEKDQRKLNVEKMCVLRMRVEGKRLNKANKFDGKKFESILAVKYHVQH